MNTTDQKTGPAPKDWHKADVKAALEKAGVKSLRQLSREAGYSSNVATRCLNFRRPRGRIRRMERLIAERLGITPAEIWPSRYPDAE